MTKTQKPSILITGFAPFDGEQLNPSWQAVSELEGEHIGGSVIHTKELPCEFGTSLKELHQAIDKYAPQLVLCVGQAGGRADISIERVAINVNDARIPDNAGKQPVDTPVIAGAPSAYFTNLPIKRMLLALQQAQIPASISNTAGTYVCNHVMYGLMHLINQHDTLVKGGFVHIPYLPSQALNHANAPSMSLETVVSALRVIITCAMQDKQDVKIAAGTTH
ncbi:pyroglutamyl-peptidase I [Pseudoalteromonas sp. S16_S37]|uniref:pyroglutamyl-peptidase I n=1 Tax=Pseudoalteromonas sp. S16_S37 TaxID=2720228 RepID=UPI001681539A|nr:pyroglutamyl-peptidase I [Pseudoalteromonas sp. S16_S37]MBD1583218.1 pyroglutamyl-peptidase I [Pseudoalteromonas sp. S16_S37]